MSDQTAQFYLSANKVVTTIFADKECKMKKLIKPKPGKYNRYGDYNEYKAEMLIGIIEKCLRENKKTIVFFLE